MAISAATDTVFNGLIVRGLYSTMIGSSEQQKEQQTIFKDIQESLTLVSNKISANASELKKPLEDNIVIVR